MAKVVKKGSKPKTKKSSIKAVKARKTTIGYAKTIAKTPDFFKAGRSVDERTKDYERKGKVAKKSKNGKWFVEYVGKDGKKHREYRANRMDYKFGI